VTESAGKILERMGVDAAKWTDEFMKYSDGLMVISDGPDGAPGEPSPNVNWGTMVGWFANAIAAGESYGYARGSGDYLREGTIYE
jgi:hypothetical protein